MKGLKLIAFLFIVLIAVSAAGCEISISPAEPEPTGPDINVVFLEQELREYIQRARAGEGSLDALYEETVLSPVRQIMTSRGSTFKLENYQKPIHNLDELENAIDLLAASDVAGIVEEALERSNEYMHGADTMVFIFPCNPDDSFTRDRMRGVRGVTGLTGGTTIISVNPTANGWEETLPYVAAHEYHHATWGTLHINQFQGNMLEVLIMEGRADAFANLVYPDLDVPWTSSCSRANERKAWENTIRDNLESTDLDFAKRVTQDDYWSGYAVGYHIVQSYLQNHPELSVDQWTEVTVQELYGQSGYEDWLYN